MDILKEENRWEQNQKQHKSFKLCDTGTGETLTADRERQRVAFVRQAAKNKRWPGGTAR